jgi:hypothetical protein
MGKLIVVPPERFKGSGFKVPGSGLEVEGSLRLRFETKTATSEFLISNLQP